MDFEFMGLSPAIRAVCGAQTQITQSPVTVRPVMTAIPNVLLGTDKHVTNSPLMNASHYRNIA